MSGGREAESRCVEQQVGSLVNAREHFAIVYFTTQGNMRRFTADRPVMRTPGYFFLPGFFAFFVTISECGLGGVFNMRRRTSSARGIDASRFVSLFMVGV